MGSTLVLTQRSWAAAVAVLMLGGCAPDGAKGIGGKACPVPGALPEGPPFEAAPAALAAALRCHAPAVPAGKPTVLLVHGTALDAHGNFSWNYVPALTARGWPVCTIDLPRYGQNDAQGAAEYVVHALREAAATSTGPVKIIGFSQGGMLPRWALRYWTDTRELADELIALAGSNHGTVVANASCSTGCPESHWQQRRDSRFLTALNRDFETVPEVDYTNVYTHFDEIVQPNLDDSGSTSLTPGPNVTNVAVQDICPGHPADHLALGSYDPVAWALALDALEHDGPADPRRIALTVCAQPFMPAVTASGFPSGYGLMLDTIGRASNAPPTAEEPPLKCYVEAT